MDLGMIRFCPSQKAKGKVEDINALFLHEGLGFTTKVTESTLLFLYRLICLYGASLCNEISAFFFQTELLLLIYKWKFQRMFINDKTVP